MSDFRVDWFNRYWHPIRPKELPNLILGLTCFIQPLLGRKMGMQFSFAVYFASRPGTMQGTFRANITGGTYARLPQGPQLSNYNELIPMIRESDETEANPLTKHELRIIARIAKTFPDNSLSKGNNSPITARKICPRAGMLRSIGRDQQKFG